MPVLVTCKFYEDRIKTEGVSLETSFSAKFLSLKVRNSEVNGLMHVLVTSKFDEDTIKNEPASLETPFSHKSMGKFFRRSRSPNSKGSGPIWPKFEHIQDFMPVFVTCKFDEDRNKTEGVSAETSFSANFSSLKGK